MINLRMFSGCIKLEKVIIPDSVKIIEGYIGEITENPNTVIYANSNSYARKYANQKGIKFSCLNFHDWDNGTITLALIIHQTLVNATESRMVTVF